MCSAFFFLFSFSFVQASFLPPRFDVAHTYWRPAEENQPALTKAQAQFVHPFKKKEEKRGKKEKVLH